MTANESIRMRATSSLGQESRFKAYAQLFKKKVVTVVFNTEYDVEYARVDDQRMYVPSYTTRILEWGASACVDQ